MNRRIRTGRIRWTVLSAFFPEVGVHVVEWVRGSGEGRPVFVLGATTAEEMPRVWS